MAKRGGRGPRTAAAAQRPGWRRRQLAALALTGGRLASAADVYKTLADVPVGCYNYGYVYLPTLAGSPATETTAMACQARCVGTAGCGFFTYIAKQQQCWLSGSQSALAVSETQGGVSGPASCALEAAVCSPNYVPGPGFPGKDAAATHRAWPAGEQPTNLQCWPRKDTGFPASCRSTTATVLEDTEQGWPGHCEGLMKIHNLNPGETCQLRCLQSPLCAVWAEEDASNGDGSRACWQGLFARNCLRSANGISAPPGNYFRSQLVMHGGYRVLMNTADMQITNLTKAFGIEDFSDPAEGAKACRKTCLSYLLCQFWQYSDVYGCFVEDDLRKNIAYPLVSDGVELVTGSYEASTFKHGEYVQHVCEPGPTVPLPTDPPVAAVVTPGTTTAAPATATVTPAWRSSELAPQMPAKHVFPGWATALIVATILLVLGAVGAAVYCAMMDRKSARDRDWMDQADARSASYDSQSRLMAMYPGQAQPQWGAPQWLPQQQYQPMMSGQWGMPPQGGPPQTMPPQGYPYPGGPQPMQYAYQGY